jgi:hypothetical protein
MEYENIKYKPTNIDDSRLVSCFKKVLEAPTTSFYFKMNHQGNVDVIQDIIFKQKKTKHILVHVELQSFEAVMSHCINSLSKFLDVEASSLLQKPFPLKGKEPVQLARFICFLISKRAHHPCLWGLACKLETPDDFDLVESLKYIWEYCRDHVPLNADDHYYPKLVPFHRRVMVHVDNLFCNDFAQYHRSGWSYVIGGLMNLDASHLSRNADVMLDTYVDRTFHWGYDILKHTGVLPYKQPWYGFIHHTFDQTHSEYNCVKLFENNDFLKSLDHCRGLFVLSGYLGEQVTKKLRQLDPPRDVPVHALNHPMEFVSTTFTIQKFLENPNRAVVQIGAWLRNPYAIYQLPLYSSSLNLKKIALRGKEMDLYFPPQGFLDQLASVCIHRDSNASNSSSSFICRDIICRAASINKFCLGLYNMIVRQMHSVQVIDSLSNDEYDKLLSENIVFLNLVDCSAVNTVIECIVRGTVLIVNRLPALEEILGEDYPGFYDSLEDAAEMCKDINCLTSIAFYLSRLNKDRYCLEGFVEQIQKIIKDGSSSTSYDLMKKNASSNIFIQKYKSLLRCLPPSFHQNYNDETLK